MHENEHRIYEAGCRLCVEAADAAEARIAAALARYEAAIAA